MYYFYLHIGQSLLQPYWRSLHVQKNCYSSYIGCCLLQRRIFSLVNCIIGLYRSCKICAVKASLIERKIVYVGLMCMLCNCIHSTIFGHCSRGQCLNHYNNNFCTSAFPYCRSHWCLHGGEKRALWIRLFRCQVWQSISSWRISSLKLKKNEYIMIKNIKIWYSLKLMIFIKFKILNNFFQKSKVFKNQMLKMAEAWKLILAFFIKWMFDCYFLQFDLKFLNDFVLISKSCLSFYLIGLS